MGASTLARRPRARYLVSVSRSARRLEGIQAPNVPVPSRPGWLTDRVWARFLAVELQRRRIAEVARAEGVSPNAVWQSVRKARAAVRAVSRASAR